MNITSTFIPRERQLCPYTCTGGYLPVPTFGEPSHLKQERALEVKASGGCCLLISGSVVNDSCGPMDCSLPGSSVHGIPPARILETKEKQVQSLVGKIPWERK